MQQPFKPTRELILAARGKTVPDLISPGLKVLFCGINPGLYTAAVGRHFARPGNRFWPALHQAGFTPKIFSPFEEEELLRYGYGIVNMVAQATARADELTPQQLAGGGRALEEKVRVFRPRFCAVLGLGAYRTAFAHPEALPGPRPEKIGGISNAWVLPSPSGINANYQMKELVRLLRELKKAVDKSWC
ncbi:MAG: G/U mismatch-specific DNA glycosylase [Deltaproteobacteria bacterium]|jgi:TDG/mug DNA glycosylase family protein|nr:G/U mismatch-specific DNA glycosylase [Deltaproteobacteria bacterium]